MYKAIIILSLFSAILQASCRYAGNACKHCSKSVPKLAVAHNFAAFPQNLNTKLTIYSGKGIVERNVITFTNDFGKESCRCRFRVLFASMHA